MSDFKPSSRVAIRQRAGHLLLIAILMLATTIASDAQTPSATVSGVSATPIPCQGGTGSRIVSVTPNAGGTLVCAAATGFRTGWRVTNTNAAAGAQLDCTDDGTTPTTTSFNFVVPPNTWTNSAGVGFVSSLAITCISSSGTTTITADAVQTGTP